ncbi:MAG TPA: hypothetical protein VNR36_14485 [Pseudolysinimonas sp.]|nr:hypothetical protein [Pseudolysinimonas sp.]
MGTRRIRISGALAAGLVVITAVVTGCASPAEQRTQVAEDAYAAVASAALALEVAPGTPVLATAVDDAMREVMDAETRAVELPAGPQRDTLLTALRRAQDALLLARDHGADAAAALRGARDALEEAGG